MNSERTIAVVMPAKNERRAIQEGHLLERVLEEIPRGYKPRLYLTVSNAPPEFVNLVNDIASQDDRIIPINLGTPDRRGLAYAYLHGLRQAINDEADLIVEMDANGSHDPIYIRDFIACLNRGNDVALSDRFSKGGGIDKYPFQRQVISRTGTLLANITLGLGQFVPDMTSGYEAFKKEVLGNLFANVPIDKWISVTKGPGHFYQTEMRALVIWRKHRFDMVPIVWGTDRMEDPINLPVKTLLKAFKSLTILQSKRAELKK